MRIDIRTKMILMIGLPIAGILIGAFILSLWHFREQSYADATEILSEQAVAYASRLDDVLDKATSMVYFTTNMLESWDDVSYSDLELILQKNVAVNTWLFGAAVAILPEFREHEGDLFSPYVFREEDEVKTMNIGRSIYDWSSDTSYEWFHGPAQSGKAQWTSPYFDEGVGNVLMTTYSSPIFVNGELIGVCTADLNLSDLDMRIQELIGLPEKFLIIAADGSYIYTPDESRILEASFIDDVDKSNNSILIESMHKAIRGETGTSRARWHIDGEEKIMAFAPIPSTGWSYITYIPASKVYDLIQERSVIPALLFVSAIILVLLSILAVSKKLTHPIIELRAKVLQVAEGNLEVKVTHTVSKDEIGDLSRSFNQMTRDLRLQITKIAREESKRREAVEANQAKSQFLSHMSHELRTPLNGVLGYAQLMQRDPDIAVKQRQNVDGIIHCGDHLLALINDVLDLSKIEAGREEVHEELLNLERLMDGVSTVTSEKAKVKGLMFSVHVSHEVPRLIYGDKGKLRQILVNLIGNAVKFTEKGSVSLNVFEVENGKIQFDVLDTGMGISSDCLELIFDPFKQSEGGQSEGGTGLGLAISRRLARLMDGDLVVKSELGKGSCFSFVLPFKEYVGKDDLLIESDDDLLSDVRLAPAQNISVLVADDGSSNRDIMEQMLLNAGFEVLMATDGDEALELLSRTDPPPAVALLDIRMARVSGIEAMKAIRKDDRCKNMKIIAVTASVFPEFKEEAIASGFDDFINKPFRISQLMSCLKEHLKLEFIHELDVDENVSSASGISVVDKLPQDAIEGLKSALAIKSLTQINRILNELKRDPSSEKIAVELSLLASKFDFNSLQRRIDSILSR